MKPIKKRDNAAAGATAKRNGDVFERIFLTQSVIDGIAVTRVPDGCKTVGRNKLIRVKSPFDWVLTRDGVTALIDTKTSGAKKFTRSMADAFQVEQLYQQQCAGCLAGYVVRLMGADRTVFITALGLRKLMLGIESTDDFVVLGTATRFNVERIFLAPSPRDTEEKFFKVDPLTYTPPKSEGSST